MDGRSRMVGSPDLWEFEREVATLRGRIGAAIMRRLALVEKIADID